MLAGWRRYWLPSALSFAGLLTISSLFFPRQRPWLEYFLFEITTGEILFSYVKVLTEELRQRWVDRGSRVGIRRAFPWPDYRIDPLLPTVRFARVVLIVTMLVGVVNGLTPYLGLKCRMSFGMFANLRVDDDRWNSLVVPRWFYLREHDPFIHVTQARVVLPPGEKKLRKQQILSEGLFTSTEMMRRIGYMHRTGVEADLQYSYAGVQRETKDVTSADGLLNWLLDIDENDRLFRGNLTLGKPQPCSH